MGKKKVSDKQRDLADTFDMDNDYGMGKVGEKEEEKKVEKKEEEGQGEEVPAPPIDVDKLKPQRIFLVPLPAAIVALLAVFIDSLAINIISQKCGAHLKEYLGTHLFLSYVLLAYMSLLYLPRNPVGPKHVKLIKILPFIFPLWMAASLILHAYGIYAVATGSGCFTTDPTLINVVVFQIVVYFLQILGGIIWMSRKQVAEKYSAVVTDIKGRTDAAYLKKLEEEMANDPDADKESDEEDEEDEDKKKKVKSSGGKDKGDKKKKGGEDQSPGVVVEKKKGGLFGGGGKKREETKEVEAKETGEEGDGKKDK